MNVMQCEIFQPISVLETSFFFNKARVPSSQKSAQLLMHPHGIQMHLTIPPCQMALGVVLLQVPVLSPPIHQAVLISMKGFRFIHSLEGPRSYGDGKIYPDVETF
jgi:hypothetical protein